MAMIKLKKAKEKAEITGREEDTAADLARAKKDAVKELQKVGKEGTLVTWLRKDAGPGKDNLPFWADKIESQVRAKKEAEEALPGEEAEEEMGEEEIEDYTDEEKAAMKQAGVRFNENATYSSFAKHQKLFENWNRYVKSIEKD